MGKIDGLSDGCVEGVEEGITLGTTLGASVMQRSRGAQILFVPSEPGILSALSHPFLLVHSQIISL